MMPFRRATDSCIYRNPGVGSAGACNCFNLQLGAAWGDVHPPNTSPALRAQGGLYP
jgi:hypothetical protein